MKNRCRQCLYSDRDCANLWKCCESKNDRECAYYTPLAEDIDIENIIESGRTEFRKQWFQYIEENDN